MKRTNWLDRAVARSGPHLCLCLSEREFFSERNRLGFSSSSAWAPEDGARVHTLEKDGRLCCIVCINGWEKHSPVAVAAMLVHEAVHVWQQHAEHIGEFSPGREQEADAVQFISQVLMAEFARRMEVR